MRRAGHSALMLLAGLTLGCVLSMIISWRRAPLVREVVREVPAARRAPCPPAQAPGRPPALVRRYPLTVALLTSGDNINMADRAFTTWASSTSIHLFVGEDFDHKSAIGLPIVKLPGVADSAVNSVVKTRRVLEYLMDNYIQEYQWFMLVAHNTYVSTDKLQSLLQLLDSSALAYLGRPVSGRERDNLELLPHERYCLGSAGVVMSRALLLSLRAHLDTCMAAGGASGGSTEWPDVELGKCISRNLNIQCSPQFQDDFVTDFSGEPLTKESVERGMFDSLVSYHPVQSPATMELLHQYYLKSQLAQLMGTVDDLQEKLGCSDCSSLCNCPSLPDKCPGADNVFTTPKSYQPTTIFDYQPWRYFDDRTIYTDRTVSPSNSLQQAKHIRKELQLMLSKAVSSASESFGRHLKFKKLLNGWVRHNPYRGSEYIVDCLFVDNFMRTVEQRVSLVRPLASNYVSLQESFTPGAVVNFVVPLSNVNSRFSEFLSSYEVIAAREKVRLVLVVYGADSLSHINSQVADYQSKHPERQVILVEGKGSFARGKALHLGMSQLQSDDLAFFCDVDMMVGEGFVDRCRKNTIKGRRVYYPEFFKLYNLDYVYRKGKVPSKVLPRRRHGHWAYYSFGMLCIYKSDYSQAGGMNTNIMGWGEEDVKFFEKVVRKKLEVLRAPDTGLSHRWHEKTCPSSLSKVQHEHCLSSRAENLADRMDLANYIYEKRVELKSSLRVEFLPDNYTMDESYLLD